MGRTEPPWRGLDSARTRRSWPLRRLTSKGVTEYRTRTDFLAGRHLQRAASAGIFQGHLQRAGPKGEFVFGRRRSPGDDWMRRCWSHCACKTEYRKNANLFLLLFPQDLRPRGYWGLGTQLVWRARRTNGFVGYKVFKYFFIKICIKLYWHNVITHQFIS